MVSLNLGTEHHRLHQLVITATGAGPPLLIRILALPLPAVAPGWLQASLRLAKGWITFTNAIFDSREPPIWVPVPARPQVSCAPHASAAAAAVKHETCVYPKHCVRGKTVYPTSKLEGVSLVRRSKADLASLALYAPKRYLTTFSLMA